MRETEETRERKTVIGASFKSEKKRRIAPNSKVNLNLGGEVMPRRSKGRGSRKEKNKERTKNRRRRSVQKFSPVGDERAVGIRRGREDTL